MERFEKRTQAFNKYYGIDKTKAKEEMVKKWEEKTKESYKPFYQED